MRDFAEDQILRVLSATASDRTSSYDNFVEGTREEPGGADPNLVSSDPGWTDAGRWSEGWTAPATYDWANAARDALGSGTPQGPFTARVLEGMPDLDAADPGRLTLDRLAAPVDDVVPLGCCCLLCTGDRLGPPPSLADSLTGSPTDSGTATGVVATPMTGNARIDGVMTGTHWNAASIVYSFPTSNAAYSYTSLSDLPANFAAVTAQVQTAAHFALNADVGVAAAAGFSAEGVTNLTISSLGASNSTTAEIRFAETSSATVPTARVADFPGNYITGQNTDNGDVWFGTAYAGNPNYDLRNPVAGNYAWATTIHEIGHALGLKHGQDVGATVGGTTALPAAYDAMEYSIMTYRSYVGGGTSGYTNEVWGFAQTFMMSDIAALQQKYGADYTTNNGNTTYSWAPGSGNTLVNGAVAISPGANRIFATIWDGGGIDTYDLSAYGTALNIDLTPGGTSLFSTTQRANLGNSNYASGNIYNAFLFNGNTASIIENAIGGDGDDTITGNQVNNTLTGGGGVDVLYGGLGNDLLRGGFVTDTVYGGDGDDTLQVLNGEFYDNSYGGTGTDTLDHAASTYAGSTFDFELGTITGFGINGTSAVLSSIEIYYDGSGDNTIVSSGTSGTYYGGGGNDMMIAENGGETMYGGAGIDTIDLSRGDFFYNFNMETGLSNYGSELQSGFEIAIMGGANDIVTGSAAANTIYGGAGNDTIDAAAGNDDVYGGAGNDAMTYVSGQGFDNFYGGADTDSVSFDWLVSLTINLATGLYTDTISTPQTWAIADVENVTAIGAGHTVTGSAVANNILTGGGNDWVDGGAGNDTIETGAGSDYLNGGAGDDTLMGGLGNDRYVVAAAGDVISGEIAFSLGGGIDTVESYITWTLGTNLEVLRLQGSANIDGFGNAAPESLVGNPGANTMGAGGGNDIINAKAGNDTLIGGTGQDTMVGDTGADVFVYNSFADSYSGAATRDLLNGFTHGQDRIDLSAIDANPFYGGDQAFTFIGNAAFGGTGIGSAGQLRYFTFGGGNLNILEADWNGDGTPELQIFILGTNYMTGTDFIL